MRVLLLLLSIVLSSPEAQSQDLARVFRALPRNAGQLVGYKITAIETNVTFDQGKVADEILRSNFRTNLDKEFITKLEEMRNDTAPVTNICTDIYKFGDGGVFISREQFDTAGKLTQKMTRLVTTNEVLQYVYPDMSQTTTGNAQIQLRKPNDLTGAPQFLSKSILRDRIDSSFIQCEIGKTLSGQDCYIVSLSPPPDDAPIEIYKLFLRSDTLSPVEFDSYRTNNTIFSHTDLQFEEPGHFPFLCRQAESQVFDNGELSCQRFWKITRVEKDHSPIPSIESFIPPGTSVWDQRFSKQLSYRMQKHLPTAAQIDFMLNSKFGVASYESGVIIHGR